MKVLFLALTKGGERVRRTGEGEQANRQERKREGERQGRKSLFCVCVAAVGGSQLRQGAKAAAGRDPQQRQAAGETPLRWDARRAAGLNTNQGKVMRPRSRLLAKRGLPTIREGYEELVQDLNQTNSQHTTTQDYFLSICHLARPTFPLHEPDCDILSIGPLDSPKPCLRLHRLRQHLQPPQPHTSTSNDQTFEHANKEKETTRSAPSEPLQAQAAPEEDNGCRGDVPSPADPLEFLYSHRGALALSTRRGSIPPRRPRSDTFPCSSAPAAPRKSSCPELCLAETVTAATVLQRSPLNRKKLDDGGLAARIVPNKLDGAPAGWRGKSSRCMDKQTIVSHWIAECRSAWKEARIRACMLPAIAEK